jgi:hypothetical protein
MNQDPNIANQNPNRDRSGGILPSQNQSQGCRESFKEASGSWEDLFEATKLYSPDFMRDREQPEMQEREGYTRQKQ